MKARSVLSLAILGGLCVLPSIASAQDIYKYSKPDGTVVYTDNLGDLPKERRAYYNEQKEKQEAEERELQQRLGKEEYDRRKAEKEKQELMKAKIDEKERKERLRDLKVRISAYQNEENKREKLRESWVMRIQSTKKRLAKLQGDYRDFQQQYNQIMTQPSYARFPGQQKKADVLRKNLIGLERQIDKLIVELTVTIPEEARKAGIPPGWLRD